MEDQISPIKDERLSLPLLVEEAHKSIGTTSISHSRVYLALYEKFLRIFSQNPLENIEINLKSHNNNAYSQSLLHEFQLKTLKIIPMMSPKAFSVTDTLSSQRVDIICQSLSSVHKITTFIQVLATPDTFTLSELLTKHRTEQKGKPSKLAQRLSIKHTKKETGKKENIQENYVTKNHSVEEMRHEPDSQSPSVASGIPKENITMSTRRGISSLVTSRSYPNHIDKKGDGDEEEGNRGIGQQIIGPPDETSPGDSSESSSSDEDIDDHFSVNHDQNPQKVGHYPEPISASNSLNHFFIDQTHNTLFPHHYTSKSSSSKSSTPSYLKSTHSSHRKVHSSKITTNEIPDPTLKQPTEKYTPFGPRKEKQKNHRFSNTILTKTLPNPKNEPPLSREMSRVSLTVGSSAGQKARISPQEYPVLVVPPRSRQSQSSKNSSNGFFEKFSGRIKTLDQARNGWSHLNLDSISWSSQAPHFADIEGTNLREKSLSPSRGRSKDRVNEWADKSIRRSTSPDRLAKYGQITANQDHEIPNLSSNPSSKEIGKRQNSSPRLQSHSNSPPKNNRHKTPDDIRLKRDNKRRNILTDAAEWSRMFDWLTSIQMEIYADSFQSGGITKLSVVELLQFHDLIQLNIKHSDATYILQCIEDMRRQTQTFTNFSLPSSVFPVRQMSESEREPDFHFRSSPDLSRPKYFTKANDHSSVTQKSPKNANESLHSENNFDILVTSLDENDRAGFFRAWETLKDFLFKSNATEKYILEQVHPLEFYLRLLFAIKSISTHPQSNFQPPLDEAMHELKLYLESLLTNTDQYVALLVNSRLFAAYGAIVLVPDPRNNPAYSLLFEDRWILSVRGRLLQFLEKLRPLDISYPLILSDLTPPSVSSIRSPTHSETELDMMKVLDTIEASEKLHKVLREGHAGGNSNREFRAAYSASNPLSATAKFFTRQETPEKRGSLLNALFPTEHEVSETTQDAPPMAIPEHVLPRRRMSAMLGSGPVNIELIPAEDSEETEEDIPPVHFFSDSDSETETEIEIDECTNPEESEEEVEYDFSTEEHFVSSPHEPESIDKSDPLHTDFIEQQFSEEADNILISSSVLHNREFPLVSSIDLSSMPSKYPFTETDLKKIEPKDDYIQYLKGNFKGLEKTRSQIILENSTTNDPQVVMDLVAEDENSCGGAESSGDEENEFVLPSKLENLHNRGSFIVMTKEEEELARQLSSDSDNQTFELDKTSLTVASALFQPLPIDTSPSMTNKSSPTIQEKKSRLSSLIDKFNQVKPSHGMNDEWNGWELVGSRWIRKNPVTQEELETAAAFYDSNRRHTPGKKKMKRHSSADLTSILTFGDTRQRARSKSISTAEFWEEPLTSRQNSGEAGECSPLTPNREKQFDLL